MEYVKIHDKLYPAAIWGCSHDVDWNNRDSMAITLKMTHDEADATFVDGVDWAMIHQGSAVINEDGVSVMPDPIERDFSEWSVAGSITDNRDGTVTVKMGKITAEEALAELMEVLGK